MKYNIQTAQKKPFVIQEEDPVEREDSRELNGIKLLIVDDEPEIANEICDYLGGKGFCCDVAFDAEKAMEKIFVAPEIGVVFTDIRMPGMSGIEMVRRLRGDLPRERELEVIFLTGFAEKDVAIEALRADALDFLSKPFKMKELAAIAERAVKLVRAHQVDQSQKRALEQALKVEQGVSKLQRKLVSSAAHEFRTPLTIIDSVVQRLIRRKMQCGPEEVFERSKIIRGAVARMNNLVERSLCMSRMDAGKIQCNFQRCDMAGLVDEVVKRQIEISPDRKFNVDTAKLSMPICGDPVLMDVVFSNLLSNSEKYSPNSSPITIRGWNKGGFSLISVTDQGVGIPDDEMPHLFKRFFRARTSKGFPGTGIGLALIKEIVEMHGGGIDVKSVEGEGATFTVRLPKKASCSASSACDQNCQQ